MQLNQAITILFRDCKQLSDTAIRNLLDMLKEELDNRKIVHIVGSQLPAFLPEEKERSKVQAIKAYCQRTGLGLVNAVKRWEFEQYESLQNQ